MDKFLPIIKDNDNQKPTWKFYAILSGLTIGTISLAYFIYNLFTKNDIEMNSDQKNRLDQIILLTQTYNEDQQTEKDKKELEAKEAEIAIKIYKLINEICEEIMTNDHQNWIIERRNLLKENKHKEYKEFCEKMIRIKLSNESQISEFLLQKLNLSQDELHMMQQKITEKDYGDIQKDLKQHQLSKNSEDNRILLEKKIESYTENEIITAFKEFLKLKNELDKENSGMSELIVGDTGEKSEEQKEEQKIQFYIKLETYKFIIDDKLLILFEMDFNRLMLLIKFRNLKNHWEIASDYNKLLNEFSKIKMED